MGTTAGIFGWEAKEELLSFCKEQFETWLRRKVKCVNCDAGAYLNERDFCPKCHVGGNLPYRAFLEKMNGLEWLPVKKKREYLKKMMCSADAEVKARATKVWLVPE